MAQTDDVDAGRRQGQGSWPGHAFDERSAHLASDGRPARHERRHEGGRGRRVDQGRADRATRFAAGLLGFATQEEVSALRSTVQTLEDNLAVMESKSQAKPGQNGGPTTHGAGR